jgi:hypothetical protein
MGGTVPPIHFAAKSRRTIAPDGTEHYEVVISVQNDAVPQGRTVINHSLRRKRPEH